MIVTAYYDIYGKPEKFIEYLSLFYDIGISGLPIVLFTDPSLVYKFRIFPSTVKVVPLPLSEVELYQYALQYKGELPTQRNIQKDTVEYYALMNAKIEFVKRAMDHTEDENLIWMDFGMLKMMKEPLQVIEKLKEIHKRVYQKMLFPGCWEPGRPLSVDQVHWRFCGTFFLMPRKDVERFYHHSQNVVRDFCTMPQYKLTWEVNVWVIIESCAEQKNMIWYPADHNDSMIFGIDQIMTDYVVKL